MLMKSLPYAAFVAEYAKRTTKRVLHSYGAIQALEKLLGLLAEDGFILINDYGPTQASREDEFEHQRFSLATFMGVNFSELKKYFEDLDCGAQATGAADVVATPQPPCKCQWVEPAGGENRGIHSRMLGKRLPTSLVGKFYELFFDAAFEKLQDPINKARMCCKSGRFELASGYYLQAIKLQPRNWVLLNEVSSFMTFQMRDPKWAIDMAKAALELNPTCSADLWNTLGDALFEFGRTAEARSAYEHAATVNSSDVRSRYNLAWVHARLRDFNAALACLADALMLDKTGEFRERLLHKQQEVLQRWRRNQQEYLLLVNLVSRNGKAEEMPAGLGIGVNGNRNEE